MAMTKNGSQQQTNAPVMMANVFAALRSRFESTEFCCFLRIIDLVDGIAGAVECDGYAIDMSLVGGSFSTG